MESRFFNELRAEFLRVPSDEMICEWSRATRDAFRYMIRNGIPPTPIHFDVYFTTFLYLRRSGRGTDDRTVEREARDCWSYVVGEKDRKFLSFIDLRKRSGETVSRLRQDIEEIAESIVVDEGREKDLLDRLERILSENRKIQEKLGAVLKKLDEMDSEIKSMLVKAVVDPLTGILTRDMVLTYVDSHIREKPCGSFVMIDLDNFKLVNDTFGHDVGDRVLKVVGSVFDDFSGAMRYVPGRYGGDEFVLFYPGSSARYAARSVKDLRGIIGAKVGDEISREFPFGFSAGVTEVRRSDAVTDLVRRADSFLYRAKEHGKDKLCMEGSWLA